MTKKLIDPSPMVPRIVIILAGMLIGLTILGVAAARIVSPVQATAEPEVVAAARNLRFADQPDHAILVTDADTGRQVTTLAPQTGEFIRITMRGLVHARKRAAGDLAAPFRIAAGVDGRLTLKDPTTGHLIELEAFGPTNAGAFAQLLTAPESAP